MSEIADLWTHVHRNFLSETQEFLLAFLLVRAVLTFVSQNDDCDHFSRTPADQKIVSSYLSISSISLKKATRALTTAECVKKRYLLSKFVG